MSLKRRDFLTQAGCGGVAVAAAAAVAAPTEAEAFTLARPNKPLPPKAVGILFDSTLCVGCKACVSGCKEANHLPQDVNTAEALWDTPIGLSDKTFNIIKLYADGAAQHKDQTQDGYAFIKQSCMHCVDPSCVSACPVSAMTKDPESGIVGYDPSACIGCRYCVAACPFGVPQAEFTTFPKIRKCEMCRHLQAEGKIPACAAVCPTGATIFGPVTALQGEVERRRAMTPGKDYRFERRTLGSGDWYEQAAAHYQPHVYGEKEIGGTQFMLMSGVPFDKLGYPELPEQSSAGKSEGLQHTLYKGMIAPAVLFAGLLFAAKRNAHVDDEHPEE